MLMNASARDYLDKADLLPSLEAGIEEMLRACSSDSDGKKDPINYLARWLMRNNPRRNPVAAARIEEMRAAEVLRAQAEAGLPTEAALESATGAAVATVAAAATGQPETGTMEVVMNLTAGEDAFPIKLAIAVAS